MIIAKHMRMTPDHLVLYALAEKLLKNHVFANGNHLQDLKNEFGYFEEMRKKNTSSKEEIWT